MNESFSVCVGTGECACMRTQVWERAKADPKKEGAQIIVILTSTHSCIHSHSWLPEEWQSHWPWWHLHRTNQTPWIHCSKGAPLLFDNQVTSQLPKIWRKAKVFVILKLGKDPNEAKCYRQISLLCHLFKLFEWLILNRLGPIIEMENLKGLALEVYCSTRAWICMNEWNRIPITWHSDAPPKARGQELLTTCWTGRVCQPTRVRLNEMPRKLLSMFA